MASSFTYLPDVWKKFPPTSKHKRIRTTPAPVSQIIIQKPKTKKEINQAKLLQSLRMEEDSIQLPDFFQIQPSKHRFQDHSFAKKVKIKLHNERQMKRDLLIKDDCKTLSYAVSIFQERLTAQKRDVIHMFKHSDIKVNMQVRLNNKKQNRRRKQKQKQKHKQHNCVMHT
jgi:hypothetical protein